MANQRSLMRREERRRNRSKKSSMAHPSRYRLVIYRSLKHFEAQIIDDLTNKTLVSASSNKKNDIKKKKADLSIIVADILTKKALEKKITKVYFDRGGYKYHGRVKSFAEALRKGGLIF